MARCSRMLKRINLPGAVSRDLPSPNLSPAERCIQPKIMMHSPDEKGG